MNGTSLIGDVVERDSAFNPSVQFPTGPTSSTGFPQHKRRWRPSAFKQQLTDHQPGPGDRPSAAENKTQCKRPVKDSSFPETERMRIDHENRQKLDSMSPEEIAKAQEDLLKGLNPALIKRLLQRANIDDQSGSAIFEPPASPIAPAPGPTKSATEDTRFRIERKIDAVSSASVTLKSPIKDAAAVNNDDREPAQIPPDLFPITELRNQTTHFPVPARVPDLDPSDPDFMANLHEKYFPDLPADPSKLAWMAPIPTENSPADKESTYYPHPDIAISALRFDFRGRFLSPRVSRSIPSTKGLHHHGQAPEAAGYTIEELSILARSAVPAQRCMSFQTLGRILYRLGSGEWGKTVNDTIAMVIWKCVKDRRVLQILTAAASVEGGHRGSQAYATEALWLFEKGGWKEKVRGR